MVLVSQIIAAARVHVDDNYDDHFNQDELGDQADGTNQNFKLNNRFILTTPNSPTDPAAFVSGAPTVLVSIDQEAGIAYFSAPPAEDANVMIQYYFALLTDPTYFLLAQQAIIFGGGSLTNVVNTASSAGLPDDGLLSACGLFLGSLAARKISSQSAWYYSASSGGKTFNKEGIAEKFEKLAEDLGKEAEIARDEVYTMHSRREIPTAAKVNIRFPSYTPRR